MRVSIRYKVLLVTASLLILAIGAYLALATYLFNKDKLAYVYDLNSSLVETLSEQTRSSLAVLVRSLSLFARDLTRAELTAADADAVAAELFAVEPDLVRVEVLASPGPGGPFTQRNLFTHAALAAELGLRAEDFEELHRRRPLPLEAIAAEPGQLHVHNSSLPPDAALLTVAVALPRPSGMLIVAADFRHDRLLRIFGRSKLHETFLIDERGEVLAHPQASVVVGRSDFSKNLLVREALDKSVDRGVREFGAADGSPLLGAYARVGLGRLTVLTQIPKGEALSAGRELLQRSTLFAIAVLLVAIIASVFFSRLLTDQIRKLRASTEQLSQGRYEIDVQVTSKDEIGDLADSFVHMVKALKEAQAHLVQSEKMAAFGQLGAGLTHEIKNPMTGIIGFAQIAQRRLDDPEKVIELLKLIEAEGLRCKDILVNFLKFARGEPGEGGVIDVNDIVQSSGKIFGHQLAMHGIKLELSLGKDVPAVMGNGNQLQQVLLNLAINTQHAIGGSRGVVTITTRNDDQGFVEISFADDGPGIPAELRHRIFEPFFTTKKVGEGSGLGLAICRRILCDHGGTMTLNPDVARGTNFLMRLPVAGPTAAPGRA